MDISKGRNVIKDVMSLPISVPKWMLYDVLCCDELIFSSTSVTILGLSGLSDRGFSSACRENSGVSLKLQHWIANF